MALHAYNLQIEVFYIALLVELSLDHLSLIAITFTQMAVQIPFYE